MTKQNALIFLYETHSSISHKNLIGLITTYEPLSTPKSLKNGATFSSSFTIPFEMGVARVDERREPHNS